MMNVFYKQHWTHAFIGITTGALWLALANPVAGQLGAPGQKLYLKPPAISSTGVSLTWTSAPAAQAYRVEYRDTFSTGAWQVCPPDTQWPQTGTNWIDPRPLASGGRYYRVVAVATTADTRGRVISATKRQSLSTTALGLLFLQNGLPLLPQNSVEVYQVVYETIDAHGQTTTASGALILPAGLNRAVPLVGYQHGTVVEKTDVASAGNGEFVVGVAVGSFGYAAAMPDYLGLGQSPGLHPYMHAKSAATAVVDLLRAARSICASQKVSLNGQLFLMGYSEGGQATMAAHRELEAYHTNEFQITASAPMAGPYDLSGTMAQVMVSSQPYDTPFYLPYTLFAYQDVYHLYDDPTQYLVQPYATTLPPLFDGMHSENTLSAAMPSVPSQIIRPEVLQDFQNNPANALRAALRDNDLYRWTPRAPMHLYHCHGDTTVPYANSQIAYNQFHANGAVQVELIDPFPAGNHSTGAYFCFFAAKNWFDTLKQ